ncbi:MAG TPA: hypothetical protein VMH90_00765, partial [Thermoplasmata archaeon]|nr:hypothetical protein [Thermoplasmata archaeon]
LGCDNSSGEVGALTSMDGGGSWSAIQSLSPIGATVPRGEQIEMAPQRQGLVVAFGTIPDDQSTAQLRLWDLSAGDEYGFTPGAVIPAPSSWTLQGSATSGAFLLTPTYLIPLGTPPYTALPFRQLQVDGGGIGLLPSVVSLVPIDTSTVEIAATNADNRGVDCWQVDVVHFAVVQTCHIRLVASLTSSASDLPIVALIDDGNGWVAIGASGAGTPGCDPQCSTAPVAGTASSSASAAGTPVGTSVCFGGCSSAEGLAAYTYAPGSSHWQALVDEAAAGVVALSGVWLLANLVAYRRSYPRPFPATSDATVVPGEEEVRRRRAATLSHRYRVGLGIWALAWAPLLLLAFFPAYGGDPAILTGAAVIGATLGALTSSFYIGEVRRRLQVSSGATIERLLGGDDARAEEVPFQMTRQLALFAYGSWTAVLVFLSLFFVTVTGGFGSEGFGSTGDPAAGPATVSAGDVLVLASLLVAVGLRALYHYQLAVATSLTQARAPPNPGTRDWAGVRSSLGAALLVWNPLVGLIVGTVLSGMLPDGPQVLAEAAVPVTLLGIALLAGAFGPTRWAPPRWVEGPGGSLAGDGPATGFATAGPPRS